MQLPELPEWVKPSNWTPETKAAARETLRVAVIFAITLFQASKTAQEIKEVSVRKITDR